MTRMPTFSMPCISGSWHTVSVIVSSTFMAFSSYKEIASTCACVQHPGICIYCTYMLFSICTFYCSVDSYAWTEPLFTLLLRRRCCCTWGKHTCKGTHISIWYGYILRNFFFFNFALVYRIYIRTYSHTNTYIDIYIIVSQELTYRIDVLKWNFLQR